MRDEAPEVRAQGDLPTPSRGPGTTPGPQEAYSAECRALILDEIRRLIPVDGELGAALYAPMLEYPLRAAKALRPAICIATCRALGGSLESVLPSAAVMELYHNAFLIHDDVEDGSEQRRDGPTLHARYGIPIAMNVGDAMLALALRPLLDNTRTLGLGKALRILDAVAHMAKVSAEGQAVELDWVRHHRWEQRDEDYLFMVERKTTWYTFATPLRVGAIVAGADAGCLDALLGLALPLGAAFQIQDDVLNLLPDEGGYGKERCGDLWEGKHTLILLRTLQCCTPEERGRAVGIRARPRPPTSGADLRSAGQAIVARLVREASLDDAERACVGAFLRGDAGGAKTAEDVDFLRALIERHDGIGYASRVAHRLAAEAGERMNRLMEFMPPSVHRDFLEWVVGYVVDRSR